MTVEPNIAREWLERRRRAIVDLIEDRRDASGPGETQAESTSELSDIDQHPADVASQTNEREMTASTIEELQAHVYDIDQALGRVDRDTYGRCQICGRPIERERLETVPEARLCREHRRAAEREAP